MQHSVLTIINTNYKNRSSVQKQYVHIMLILTHLN